MKKKEIKRGFFNLTNKLCSSVIVQLHVLINVEFIMHSNFLKFKFKEFENDEFVEFPLRINH